VAILLVPREQVRAVLLERIHAGEELVANAKIAEEAWGYSDWNYLFAKWREHTLAELRAVYEGKELPLEFEAVTLNSDHSTPRFTFPYARASLDRGLAKLNDFLERLPLAVEPESSQTRGRAADATPRRHEADVGRVFIVHGRAAGGFLNSVAQFIEQLGLSPVILAEQANEGRTLIEKFEAHALDVGFAIVLLTPEDHGYGPDDQPPPRPNRARQNVILELGYFLGSLDRKNVVALQQEGLDVPTDILGIVYIPLDEGGVWKTLLVRELQAAGYDIDASKLLGQGFATK
jgi:predicted nucleotide-binding protein